MARKLDKIYIVDIEATFWTEKTPDGQISEIIQVGIVEFNLPSGSISSKVSHNISCLLYTSPSPRDRS